MSGNKSKSLQTVVTDKTMSENEFLETLSEEDKEFFENLSETNPDHSDNWEFLVRGAKLRCSCGTHVRMLNLPRCHGVYIEGHPLIRKEDCVVGDDENITSFGVCESEKNPEEKIFGDNILLVSENDPSKNVKGAPCMPLIVDEEWKNTYYELLIKDDKCTDESVSLDSYLICAYGGLIQPETSGQENVDTESIDFENNIE